MPELYKPGQYPLLRGAGKTGMTGPETKSLLGSHIILYEDDFGSHRFVYHINGKSISVLQVMGFEPPYVIANVYTEKNYRRKGYAELLIKKARDVLGTVIHADPKDQSEMGKTWAKSVKEPAMYVENIKYESGPAIETKLSDNIFMYCNDYGTCTFEYHIRRKVVSSLSVLPMLDNKSYIIINVYTEEKYRRRGYANDLLKMSRKILGTVLHDEPGSQTDLGKVWVKSVKEAAMSNTSDIVVNSVEFAAGQEPEYSDTFATLVRANYTIKGKKLAQILGKQMRVLDKYLYELSKYDQGRKIIINRVMEDDEVLVKLTKSISNFVTRYLVSEFQIENTPKLSIENASESDLLYTVDIYSRDMKVVVETEFDVMAE